MKPIPDKSLDTFCQIYTDSRGKYDITCTADDYHISCLAALERRGLIRWDTERTGGKMKRWCALTKLGAQKGCEELAVMPVGYSDTRNRVCLSIFLDLNNDNHSKAWEVAQSLKQERIFTPVMTDLLIMHKEFLAGDTTTLQAAYPAVYQFMTESKHGELLSRLEELLQNTPQSHENGLNSIAPKAQGQVGIKALNVQAIPLPNFDDDDETIPVLTIRKGEQSGNQANKNLIASLAALQGK